MYYKTMIKEFMICVVASAISLACLGLLAAVMARDSAKDINIGPPYK